MTEWSLLGRTGELARAERVVEAVAHGPVAVTMAGDAGIGKTAIWQAVITSAAARDDRLVLTARATQAEADLPYVALTDLLAEIVRTTDALDHLPAPQAAGLAAALLLDDAAPARGRADPRVIGTAVVGAIQRLASDRPVILAIDDVQWIDDASAAALTFALRRLTHEGRSVGLLTTLRTPAADPLATAMGDAHETLDVGPVSLGVLHALLRERLAFSLDRPQLVRLEAASGGNPLLALEIGRELRRLDRWPLPGEPLPVPADASGLIAERIARLDPGDRVALFVAAAVTDPRTPVIAAGLDRAASEVDASAHRLGPAGAALLHRASDDTWRFEHPLVAAAALSAIEPGDRRSLHARLAIVATTPEDRGRHAALAAEGPDADAADLVDAAARSAQSRGAPMLAATWWEVAADLTPEDAADPAVVGRRRFRAAKCFGQAGAVERATSLLDRAIPDLPAGDERADALEFAAQMSGWVEGEAAVMAVGERALAEARDPRIRARVLLRMAMASSAQETEAALAMADEAVAILEPTDVADTDPDLLACALIQAAGLRFESGRGSDDAAIERACALLGPEPRPGADGDDEIESLRAFEGLHVWAIDHDRLDEGLRRLEVELARAYERGHDRAVPIVEGEVVMAAVWAGDVAKADAHARAAVEAAALSDHPETSSATLAAVGMAALLRGDVDAAAAAATEGLGTYGQLEWLAVRHRASLGSAALARGDAATATRWLGEALDQTVAAGRRESLDGRFAGDLVEAAVATGDLERARATVELLDGSVQRNPRPWVRVMAARGRALVQAAEGDLDGASASIEQALIEAEALPMPVERARTELVAGRIARRRKEKRRAAEHLGRAIDGLRSVGSLAWLHIAEAELARVVGRRVPALDGVGSSAGSGAGRGEVLTETEDQVARLAARGLTNRQVGEAAFLTPKSVEGVLSRVYQKLGIRSRAELGAWLASQDGGATHRESPVSLRGG